MMGNLDWGGTCFARYRQGATAFISKTDEIMSKFRPIAPKPTAVISNASESNSNCKPNTDPALGLRPKFTPRKGKKIHYAESGVLRPIRTRSKGESSYSKRPSPRGPKRPKVGPIKGCSGLGGSERSTPVNEATVQKSSIAADRPTKIVCPFDASSRSNYEGSGCMERAAAISCSERSGRPYKKTARLGGVTIIDVLNSIGRVGAEKPPKSMEAVSEQTTEDTQCGSGSPELLVFPDVRDSQRQVREEEKGKSLVTLPLLPETPSLLKSLACGSSDSNSPYTNLKPDMPDASADKGLIQLRLFGINFIQKSVGPCQTSKDESPKPTLTSEPSVDFELLNQRYSESVDPVILMLDSDRKDALWFNPAYISMIKATEERNSNTDQPLIRTPTPLASYTLKSAAQGAVDLKAILWGFVNKFSIPETASGSNNETSINRENTLTSQASSSNAHFVQRSPNDAMSGMPPTRESLSPAENVVITPQANRPVGSIIDIEYIKETNRQISPLCKTVNEIRGEMEREALPALISDSTNRVNWTNSAYKKMVGQPECSWLKSKGGLSNDKFDGSNSWINGEVILKKKIPLAVSALKCSVRIQWTNSEGKESLLRAPCEVYKFVTSNPMSFVYAWRFHIVEDFFSCITRGL